MATLAGLKETLESLESYKLPEKFSEEPVDKVLDDELIQRYQSAREDYIQSRMLQVFYGHLGSLENGEFRMPGGVPTQQEQDELVERRNSIQAELMRAAAEVNQSTLSLQAKYSAVQSRKEELAKMIRDIEQNPMSQDFNDDDTMMDDDEYLNQEALENEGTHLAELAQRKAELEVELKRIRHEKALAQKSLQESKKEVEELRSARGEVARIVSPETVEELEAETQKVRQKVGQLKDMSEWYDGLSDVVEEISGIKLLYAGQGTSGGQLVIKVKLLNQHQVNINMSSRGNAFCVESASFVTPTLVRSTEDPDTTKSVQMTIPALDDLVKLSVSLGSVNDLRFLLRETVARIKTITARVDELAILRSRYVTQIGKMKHNTTYSFGGEDQEVVCSLNEGITAKIRLNQDCPLISGSVYLEELVGTGGWNSIVLKNMKDSVNARSDCKGPVDIMEELTNEIQRIQKEEGVVLPRTPKMPTRQG